MKKKKIEKSPEKNIESLFLNLSIDPFRANRFFGIPFYGFIAGNTERKTGYLYIQFRSLEDFNKAIKQAQQEINSVLT